MFEAPLGVEEALDIFAGWLAQPVATVVEPSGRHLQNLRALLAPLGTAGNLCSRDGDFARFPGLRWRDPLA